MIIKNSTVITNRLRELTGLSHFKNAQLRNIAVAKVALEENNFKAALEIILAMQLNNLDTVLMMDDVTKILNTPLVSSEPETIRDMILPSVQPKKKEYTLEELVELLFPGSSYMEGGVANGLSSITMPENCDELGSFQDKNYKDLRRHYLVKMEDGLLVHFRICAAMSGCGYDAFAVILQTGPESADRYKHLKKAFAK